MIILYLNKKISIFHVLISYLKTIIMYMINIIIIDYIVTTINPNNATTNKIREITNIYVKLEKNIYTLYIYE
jgi:hypothetical protein